jgi:CRISPR-associated protein Cmr3
MRDAPEEDFKPKPTPPFWSAKAMERWLSETESPFSLEASECLSGPGKDERTHVVIAPDTGAAQDSLLFSTIGLDFRIKKEDGKFSQMTAAIEAEPPEDYREWLDRLSPLHTLGGERRLAEWRKADKTAEGGVCAEGGVSAKGWRPFQRPPSLRRLRMILATPGIFLGGWLPGWLDKTTGEGTIPGTLAKVRLVSAVTGRWRPLSGWNYEIGRLGPKPLRRMVPAGSVYFFEIVDESSLDWESLWLQSVCDDPQDRNDGFGAALWGPYSEENSGGK